MVIRFGSFRTEMSFINIIRRFMIGYELVELLELEYASYYVVYMLNGKAVSRVVRGNLIINMALGSLLLH